MAYLLNAAYLAALVVVLPWLLVADLLRGKRRGGWRAKLTGRVPRRTNDRYCVWLHAVSVGEVNLLRTLVAELEERQPDWECVISTSTVTGYELARKRFAGRLVFYCPFDFTWAVRAAMSRVRPNLLVLAELELWPNLIAAARTRGARVAVINGRLSAKSFRGYERIGWLAARLLRGVDLVAAQNEEYAARFRALGAPAHRVQVTGSLKYDGAQTDRSNTSTRALAALAGIAPEDPVFVAGSTQDPEESLAVDAFLSCRPHHPELRLVLVPRHAERFDEVAEMLRSRGVPFVRRSQLGPHHKRPSPEARVLLVDTIGELGAWWGTATVGFVGGSLTQRGGQNMIEPAAYGVATCFGPNTQNFRDVVETLLAAGGAEVVRDGQELTAFVRRALDAPEEAAALGRRARQLVAQQLGATTRTIDLLLSLTETAGARERRAA
ncbi:MAG: 3-deoxy-D-manno-octulosonic acid transferase [Pirellulales bacterium]|nr:3-deoxy-D-manno-octulosonic acid transferase [Pirellulales bacterium]